MKLESNEKHPHGLTDKEYDKIFTHANTTSGLFPSFVLAQVNMSSPFSQCLIASSIDKAMYGNKTTTAIHIKIQAL